MRWGSDAEGGAPYIFKDPKNPDRNIGFEVEIIAALEKELGRPIVFKQYAFQRLTEGLQRRDIDLAMNGLEITPDRLRQVRFSRPYYVYQQQLVVRAKDKRFQRLQDCKQAGATVGTMEDTAADRILDRERITRKIYEGPVEAYQDLKNQQVDAVLLDVPIAAYYALPQPELRLVGEPFEKGYYAIAFHKDDQELADQINAALEKLLQSGELKKIYEKWHIWNDDQNELRFAGAQDILAEARQQWTFSRYFPELAYAAWITVQISVLSMLLAICLGLPIALCRLYGPLPLRWLAMGYVEFFRGIPVLLLLVLIYYGLPGVAQTLELPFTLRLEAFQAAVLGLGLNYAAYEAEIYRAGIGSIPDGQWEAAASLGMSSPLTFRRIILPQAMRVILPPMTSDFIALFKDTSIASVITVVELTKQYQILAKSSMLWVQIGLTTALLYLVMSVPLGYLSRYLEARWSRAFVSTGG